MKARRCANTMVSPGRRAHSRSRRCRRRSALSSSLPLARTLTRHPEVRVLLHAPRRMYAEAPGPHPSRAASRPPQDDGAELAALTKVLLDHFARELADALRHGDAERLRGLEIDHEVELGRNLHRQLGRARAFENARGVAPGD